MPEVRNLRGDDGLLLTDDAPWPDLAPPLCAPHAALADAWPVVLEPAQYARAARLGLTGTRENAGKLGSMQFEAVLLHGNRFEPAQHAAEQTGAEIAFLFPARDAEGEIVDVVAWVPETGKAATLLGEIGTLGLDSMWEFRIVPPIVHETLLDWLLAPEDGFFIVDPRLAARELENVTIAATDRDAALRLRAKLAPHCTRTPNIVVPRKAKAA